MYENKAEKNEEKRMNEQLKIKSKNDKKITNLFGFFFRFLPLKASFRLCPIEAKSKRAQRVRVGERLRKNEQAG